MLAKITDGGTFTNWGTNIGGKLGIDITPDHGAENISSRGAQFQ